MKLRQMTTMALVVSRRGQRAAFIKTIGILFLATLVVRALAQNPVPPRLLGQGRGIDHVGAGVRDLSQAQHDYEQLGFKVSEGGHFPGGLFNCAMFFGNKTYLELLSVKGADDSKGNAADIADFVRKHEGAMFLGLHVSSANAAASYLKMQNFDVSGPNPGSIMHEGETKPPPPMWYTVSTADKPAPNKQAFRVPIFLIEYLSEATHLEKARTEGRMEHPNSAIGIHAVWFAVHDSQAQVRSLGDAGIQSESREVQLLGDRGRELKAGSGAMVLLGAKETGDSVRKYLSDHDDGIIAVSVEVSDLLKARRMAESVAGHNLEVYRGAYGQSFLVPPDVTHGVWLEMFQR